jgi:hypothetical protein
MPTSGRNLPDRLQVAAVDAATSSRIRPPDDLAFDLFEQLADKRADGASWAPRGHSSPFTLASPRRSFAPLGLADDGVSPAELLGRESRGPGRRARLLRAWKSRGSFAARSARRMMRRSPAETSDAEHDGAEHHVLGQFLGLRFDHQDGVLRARDDEVELGILHPVGAG